MFTLSFFNAAAERAIKTLAQSLIAVLAVGQTTVLTIIYRNTNCTNSYYWNKYYSNSNNSVCSGEYYKFICT